MDMASWFLTRIAVGLALALLLSGCISGCGEGYSEGERTGVVTKLSRKGLFFKSWEAEMNVGGVRQTDDGLTPNMWSFHVGDELVPEVQGALQRSERVSVRYRQWVVPPIDQSSSYDAKAVEKTVAKP